MNVSFSVAMVLNTVNNMGPGIRSAQNMMRSFGQAAQTVARQTSSLNPVQGWEEKIYRVAEAAKKIGKELKESGKNITEQGERIQHSGVKNVMEGAGLAAPVLAAVNKAAELQMKQTSMRMSGVSREGVSELMKRADKYTERTLFSKTEIADMYLSMRQSGMLEQNILRGSEPMVMLAELENIRRGTPGTETAKILSQMAERAGILQDPNIERWEEFLEIVNQVTTITTAGMHELHESSKYLEPVTRIAGWSEKDVMMSQGVAARFGLEGSIAGTDLKDMIQRLNPYKWLREEGNSSKALEAMERLGWLKDYQSVPGRMGRKKYTHIGGSAMLNDDGSTVNMLEMFGQFAQAWERYKDLPNSRALFQADMFKVLGEQGQKTALLVSQNYDVIKQMMSDAQNVKPIHGQIDEFQLEYLQNYSAFKKALGNLEIDAGNLLLSSGTETLKTLREWVAAARQFTNTYPDLISGTMKFVFVLGGLKIGLGVIKILIGTIMTLFGEMKTGVGWFVSGVGWMLKSIINLKVGFDLIRATGAGFWRSLWQGAQLAWPWLARLVGWAGTAGGFLLRLGSYGLRFGSMLGGGAMTAIRWLGLVLSWIGRLVGGWMVAAVRIAAGWLIAMGPVGWIIAGVTAIIAAAIWAWNTNFMGFRDKCIQVWNAISSWAQRTWSNIVGFVQTAIGWIGGFIDKIKAALGLSRNLPSELPKIRGVDLDPKDFKPFGPDNTPVVSQGGGRNYYFNITNNNDISASDPEGAGESVVKLSVPGKYKASLDPSFG